MDRPELASDPRFATHGARGAHAIDLDAIVTAWTTTLDADTLLARLAANAVPAGRVYTAADMLTDPHYAARNMVLRAKARAGFEVPMTGVVPRFSRTPGAVVDVGPELGEHTDVVEAEIDAGRRSTGSAARTSPPG
jgi:crotonobetainyl-CoA:carnitine CoA-transferase CaiB-like acyl-CoA transferase